METDDIKLKRTEKIQKLKKKIEDKVLEDIGNDDINDLTHLVDSLKVDIKEVPKRPVEKKGKDDMETDKEEFVMDYDHTVPTYNVLKLTSYYTMDYHDHAPSGDTLFKLHLSHLLQFPTIENLFHIPKIIPFLWLKTPDKWKKKMSFSEIVYELDRAMEALKYNDKINCNTIYAKLLLSNMNSKNVTSEKMIELCNTLMKNLDKVSLDEKKKNDFTSIISQTVLKNRKSIKNTSLLWDAFRYVQDLGKGNNFRFKDVDSFEKYEYPFHIYRADILQRIRTLNQTFLDSEETAENAEFYIKSTINLQRQFITTYADTIINILCNASAIEFTDKDKERLSNVFSKGGVKDLLCCVFPVNFNDVNEIKSGTFELLAIARTNSILKRKIFNSDLVDVSRRNTITSTLELTKFVPPCETLKYLVSEMNDPDISRLSKKYEEGLRNFSKFHSKFEDIDDNNQKAKKIHQSIEHKLNNFNQNISADRPILKMKQ